MEKCKICGKELKDRRGLILHLRGAHKMEKSEYDEKYGDSPSQVGRQEENLQMGKEEMMSEIAANKIENHDKKLKEEMEQKNNKETFTMKINDVEWLDKKIRSEWVVVFEEDGIMQSTEPVAMGIITTETEQVPSLLIMATNGKLIPPLIFESFRGIYTYKELKAMEKSKREEEKLQGKNIVKERKGISILKSLRWNQKPQKQDKLVEKDILNRIKASMDETEAISHNEREGRINTRFTNPNIFHVDMQRLARQSNNILNFKRKR